MDATEERVLVVEHLDKAVSTAKQCQRELYFDSDRCYSHDLSSDHPGRYT